MKHYVEYVYNTQELFFDYLKTKDLDLLIKGLRNIETLIEKTIYNVGDKSLWFKMTEDDTLSTTIGNINADLSLPSNHPNHKLMISKIDMVVSLYGDIRIYFS